MRFFLDLIQGLLVLAGIGAAIAGVMTVTQGTAGVGFMAGACFLGILARIAQAAVQHDENRRK